MDWGKFFEDTRRGAGVESFAKLAPLLHVTDGAISNYRTGKNVPSAWVVAKALKLQGHENPEREAARIMKEAAKSADERAFWRKLGTAAILALAVVLPYRPAEAKPETLTEPGYRHYAKWLMARALHLFRTFVTERTYGTSPVLA